MHDTAPVSHPTSTPGCAPARGTEHHLHAYWGRVLDPDGNIGRGAANVLRIGGGHADGRGQRVARRHRRARAHGGQDVLRRDTKKYVPTAAKTTVVKARTS